MNSLYNALLAFSAPLAQISLETYYQSLKVEPHIPNEPHPINTYGTSETTFTAFRLIKPLERESICTTFLAETKEPSTMLIVVKFVHRYNDKAHNLLADADMALKLRYFGNVGVRDDDPSYGHLQMVFMDYVDGTTVDRMSTSPFRRHSVNRCGPFCTTAISFTVIFAAQLILIFKKDKKNRLD